MSILNTPPTHTQTPIEASCFGEKVENVKKFTDERTDGQTEKDLWTDSRTYARTDRQNLSEKSWLLEKSIYIYIYIASYNCS